MSDTNSAAKIIPSLLFILVGLGIIAIGYFKFIVPGKSYIAKAVKAEAQIISTLPAGSIIKEYPLAQYIDKSDGSSYQFSPAENGKLFRYWAGQQISIYYIPGSGGDARFAGFVPFWYEAILTLAFGLPFFLIGLLVFILGMLGRDSLFTFGESLSLNSPVFIRARVLSIIAVIIFVILLFIKGVFDMPLFFYSTPYFILIFAILFTILITFIIIGALLENKK